MICRMMLLPARKGCVNWDPSEGAKQASRVEPADSTRLGHLDDTIRFKKLSRWNLQPVQSNESNEVEALHNGTDSAKSLAKEGKNKRGKTVLTSILNADKMKALDSALVPSTSMAAHVEDEEVEIELDRLEVNEPAATGIGKGPANEIMGVLPFQLPPPPPIRRNGYLLVCHLIIANFLRHYIILISYLDFTPFSSFCFFN
ncbi:hypothetical protein F2P56_001786 [Juglans regia]|uniref:Uncharacterized protein n=1 Tax=Juglans regia TaxID=51240 RepID=A0A834D4F2_JUGRE|nr:hypothetical protein F2P56_001786 [Juglans regia]